MKNKEIQVGGVSKINSETIGGRHSFKEILYLDTGNITRNKLDRLQTIKLGEQVLPSRAQRKVSNGTIVYSTVRPLQEHYGFMDAPPNNLIVSTGFTTIDVVDDSVDPKFLYYCLTEKNITNYLNGIASSNVSSYPSINPEDLANLKFKIPADVNLQRKLAKVLNSIESKVSLNEAINDKLLQIARTLFQYWFVQFEFPSSNGQPYKQNNGQMKWSEKLKKSIPISWDEISIADLAEQSTETVSPSANPEKIFRHYSIPAFDELGTYSLEHGSEIKSDKFLIDKNDILVSKLNPWFNRVIYSTNDANLISSTEFVVWRAGNALVKNFLYMLATDVSFIKFCTQSATGTSNSHKRVNPELMMSYCVAGNIDVIKQFGSSIDGILKLRASNEVENTYLKTLKNWLHPLIVNRKIQIDVV